MSMEVIIFLIVLLFPFYWMAITTFKPNVELMNYKDNNPFWINNPTFSNINKLLFETDYGHWLLTTMGIAIGSTFLSLLSSVLAAYARARRLALPAACAVQSSTHALTVASGHARRHSLTHAWVTVAMKNVAP